MRSSIQLRRETSEPRTQLRERWGKGHIKTELSLSKTCMFGLTDLQNDNKSAHTSYTLQHVFTVIYENVSIDYQFYSNSNGFEWRMHTVLPFTLKKTMTCICKSAPIVKMKHVSFFRHCIYTLLKPINPNNWKCNFVAQFPRYHYFYGNIL